MGSSGFSIQILEQGWLPGVGAENDFCSHGRLEVIIGGCTLSATDDSFGISESALALLRTLDDDYEPGSDPRNPTNMLVFHGCGSWLMWGCYIGIVWRVRHTADGVRISDVLRDEVAPSGSCWEHLDVTVPTDEYEREVASFANEAKSLFEGVEKRGDAEFYHPDFPDEFGTYDDFWREFDQRLSAHSGGRSLDHP